jgi:hypothetical protein
MAYHHIPFAITNASGAPNFHPCLNVPVSIIHFDSFSLFMLNQIFLVGGFNPSEKYEGQLGLLCLYGKIKLMFQTTNQFCLLNR